MTERFGAYERPQYTRVSVFCGIFFPIIEWQKNGKRMAKCPLLQIDRKTHLLLKGQAFVKRDEESLGAYLCNKLAIDRRTTSKSRSGATPIPITSTTNGTRRKNSRLDRSAKALRYIGLRKAIEKPITKPKTICSA